MRKCAHCRKKFEPKYSSLQNCCSPKCALAKAQKDRKENEKHERQKTRAQKEALLTPRDWHKKTQPVFNRWIRLRDHDQPCISCGRYDHEIEQIYTGGKWDCGHFLTVGAYPELRYEPLNAHKQCKGCNSGSYHHAKKQETVRVQYRENLIIRIGLANVEWLEGPHDPKRYTSEDLKRIKMKYAKLANELQRKLQARQ